MSEEEEYRHVYEFIANHSYPTGYSKNQKRVLRRKCQERFCIRSGLLYYACEDQKWRQVARSVEDRERIMQSCHSSAEGGHLGRDETYQKISERDSIGRLCGVMRRSMFKSVKLARQRMMLSSKTWQHHCIHPVKSKVWNQVGIDLVGPLPKTQHGNRFIITLVDFFSKWSEAEALPDKSAKSISLFLYKIMYGCTKVVISDQGREFVNKVNRCLFKMTNTEHRMSSAYHPQTNGLVERFNQTLQRSLVKLVNDNQNDWDELLDGVLFAYRTSIQKSTQVCPFELMYCRKAILPIEAELGNVGESEGSTSESESDEELDSYIKKIKKLRDNLFSIAKTNIDDAQLKQKHNYDRKHGVDNKKELREGTLVWLRNSARDGRKGDKLSKQWLGPYKVSEVLGKGLYRLANPKTGHVLKKTYNRCRLKHCYKRSTPQQEDFTE